MPTTARKPVMSADKITPAVKYVVMAIVWIVAFTLVMVYGPAWWEFLTKDLGK